MRFSFSMFNLIKFTHEFAHRFLFEKRVANVFSPFGLSNKCISLFVPHCVEGSHHSNGRSRIRWKYGGTALHCTPDRSGITTHPISSSPLDSSWLDCQLKLASSQDSGKEWVLLFLQGIRHHPSHFYSYILNCLCVKTIDSAIQIKASELDGMDEK